MDLEIARSAPNPQILASIDKNRDGKDPIYKLIAKEARDIMWLFLST